MLEGFIKVDDGKNIKLEILDNKDNKEYKVAKIKMSQDIRKNAEEHGIVNKKILKSSPMISLM